MRAARRHPIFLVLALAAVAALGLVAVKNDWSELGLYAGMTAVIFVLGLIGALLEVRQRGPAVFGDRGGSSRAGAGQV
jgi:hypothetical protein